MIEELIDRYGFVRAKLTLKWHFAYCAHMETALLEHGVRVLHPPNRARRSDGFLREELSEGLTHGNQLYGSMVWEDLDRLFS
jgi:predicted alpha-1,6-mannanase (GH76 family)